MICKPARVTTLLLVLCLAFTLAVQGPSAVYAAGFSLSESGEESAVEPAHGGVAGESFPGNDNGKQSEPESTAPSSATPPEASSAPVLVPPAESGTGPSSGVEASHQAAVPPPSSCKEETPSAFVPEGEIPEEPPVATVPLEELREIARQDPARAAALVNALPEDGEYGEALRAVLLLYYEEELWTPLATFTTALDERATLALERFAQAERERRQGEALGYRPGEMLVVYHQPVAAVHAEATLRAMDAEVAETVEAPAEETVVVAELPLDMTVGEAVVLAEDDPAVAYAQPNYVYHALGSGMTPQAASNDPEINRQWQLDAVHAFQAWDILDEVDQADARAGRPQRNPVLVAVVDQEVQHTHPDLQEMMRDDLSANTSSGAAKPPFRNPKDHGTHVAGIIGARANNNRNGTGVGSGRGNQAVRLVSVDVFTAEGKCYTSHLIPAVNYALEKNIRVINMSLGSEGVLPTSPGETDRLLEEAIAQANAKGTVVVTAAGNQGQLTGEPVNGVTSYCWPGDLEGTINVINAQRSGNTYSRSPTSNYGNNKTISAPGAGIYSTMANNGFASKSGTSMAAPVVAGVVAMMLYINPNLTPAEVRNILQATANDIGTPGFDAQTAAGLVNAEAAVAGVRQVGTPAAPAAQAAAYDEIAVRWGKVPGATGYRLYRSTSPAGEFQPVPAAQQVAGLSFQDTGLKTGQTYYYKVMAYRTGSVLASESDLSAASGGATPVLQAAGAPWATTRDVTRVVVAWQPVPGADGYLLRRGEGDGSLAEAARLPATVAAYEDTGLKPGGAYRYTLTAYRMVDGQALFSGQSAELTVRLPVAPANNLRSANVSYNSVDLYWSRTPGASGYELYRSTRAGSGYALVAELPAGRESYTDTGLATGATYYYRVAAYAGRNGGKLRAAQTPPLAVRPQLGSVEGFVGISASAASNRIRWQRLPGATGYELYRADKKNRNFKRIAVVTGTSYLDKKLTLGENYRYRLRPYRKAGRTVYGKYTPVVAVKAGVPAPARLEVTVAGYNSLRLQWSRSAGAEGYDIYRATSAGGRYIRVARNQGGNNLRYLDEGLRSGRAYCYKILPYLEKEGKEYFGSYSEVEEGIPQVARPSGLRVSPSRGQVRLRWRKSRDASGYRVYRADRKDGRYRLVKTLPATATRYIDKTTRLQKGKTYYYKVVPYRSTGSYKGEGQAAGPKPARIL